jgi:hypothetical protein
MIKSVQSAAAALSAPLSDAKDDMISGARRARKQLVVGLDDAIRNLAQSSKELARSSKARRMAVDRARRLGSQTTESLARHPFIAAGMIAGACYLLARRLWRRAKPTTSAPAARKASATRTRRKRPSVSSAVTRSRVKTPGANGNAQAE